MKGVVLPALVVAMLAVSTTGADAAPLSLLELMAPRAGDLEVHLAIGVVPSGFRATAAGGRGGLTPVSAAEYGVEVVGTATYYVTESVGLSLSAAASGSARQATVQGTDGAWQWIDPTMLPGIGAVWRTQRSLTGAAEVRLDFMPGAMSAVWVQSSIADPLVVSYGLGLHRPMGDDGPVHVSGSVGIALVANELWSVRAAAIHRVSVMRPLPPETRITWGAFYTPRGSGSRRMGVEVSLSVAGTDVRAGFGLTYHGAGLRP